MPRVSILMPIYNAADFLGETLETLKGQTYDDVELVIVNDGSSDDWQNVLDRADMPRVRVIEQENQGLVVALNNGLNHIDAELIARADADDLYDPNRIEAQVELMDFAHLDATAPRVLNIDERGRPMSLSRDSSAFYNDDPYGLPPQEPYLQHPFMMVRGEVLQELKFRQAHLSEDADLCWRLYDNYRSHMSADILGRYRVHTYSISSGSVGKARVQAFYAALSAFNTQRRRANAQEIMYQGTLQEAIGRACSIHQLARTYQGDMSNDEYKWLCAASSAKLIDLATWRNFVLTEADLKMAKSDFANLKKKDAHDVQELRNKIEKARSKMDGANWDDINKPSIASRLFKRKLI